MGEELELPRIQPKGTEKIVAWKDKYSALRRRARVAAPLPPDVQAGDRRQIAMARTTRRTQ